LANASGIPKSDAVRTNEAHDQSWTIPGWIMGNQKFGSKSRLHITNPRLSRGKPALIQGEDRARLLTANEIRN
jgi:hypothetical protein